MHDRQSVFLGRRTEQAVLYDRAHRRVPRHLGSGQITEEVEGMDLVLEARLWVDLGLVLVDVQKMAIDRVASLVGAQADVTLQANHTARRQPLALDRGGVAAPLGAKC